MSDDPPATRQSLEASRKKFEAIFEHANDAIFIVDIENDSIVDCNPRAAELVEYSREELLSMPASDLHPHNLPQFMEFAEGVLQEGHGWTDDITCYCKSGDIIPAEMSASVVELDGRPHLVNHIRGTTDRDERDWFEALIEHSSDLITVVKPDGTIRYQSASIDHVLGYEPSELRDEVYYEFIHPDDAETIRAALDWVTEQAGSVVRRLEYRFRRSDGSWAWLESIVSYRPDTPITGYVVNARDVTARKESQQQAAVLNRVLRHNLRNGLNVILAHAESLADTDSPAVRSGAEKIETKAWDLYDATSYTKDLADILESHQVPQQRQDVAALVEGIVAKLSDVHPDVSFGLDTCSGVYARTAPKFDVALEHVVRNAVEHNDAESPRVTVTVDAPAGDSEYVEVRVEDNGPGIPAQDQEVLLEGEETPLKHGSGLGLWIVNWIITRSGGRISFDEVTPRGSRVTLAVPPAE